ncbi:hypothetical protein N7481_008138 [Penicillium waksmanii]|uniref:uncharacterized protein n=1 Tax=Penicillium waksmanii TaxID=69791 RepID=UPI0025495275|nr:uncharacterized protein N7481_008138 [Penicillium waksmanii]KAJ5980840.1 hypothetical protein N7481_008138 [Penicillium waksmanii]
MIIPKTLVILATALSATATHVHNQFGKDGYIQDDQGSEIFLKNKGSVTVGGGWGFFWVASSVCSKNSVAYTWPTNYGEYQLIYIQTSTSEAMASFMTQAVSKFLVERTSAVKRSTYRLFDP